MFNKAIKALFFSIALIFLGADWAMAQKAPSEHELKAAFLYNFLKFVEWPQKAFLLKESPFVIGVMGADPFAAPDSGTNYLDQIVAGKSIDGRELLVRRIKHKSDLKECQLLFISTSEKGHLKEIFDSLQGSHVLTVSETDDFCQEGGIINFVKLDGKIRFEINLAVAEERQLKISSRLLNVSKIISAQPGKKP